MNILVTGARGFLGSNLILELKARNHNVFEIEVNSSTKDLEHFSKSADFVVHLAGINRPLLKEEFFLGNSDFTVELINHIKHSKNKCPIIFSSSIQAASENDYGRSKKMAEEALFTFQKENGNKTYIYRLSNLFGKWSRPNYNSVVATFCFNISHDLPIQISNPLNEIPLVYIDDVVDEFVSLIEGAKRLDSTQILEVKPIYAVTLGRLAEIIRAFKETRRNLLIPSIEEDFSRKLYATYLSYLDPNDFAYNLNMNKDSRGSFTEFLKTSDKGQLSVNVTRPGNTKGNHFHNTKNEKFLVVSGIGEIKFRKVGTSEVISYKVSGEKMTVVDIPPGFTHSITNIGSDDLITLIWASEPFNPEKPDTIFLDV